MFTNLLKWLKPKTTQETQESVLLKHAIENNQIEIEENDTILFDKGLAGYGTHGQRQEAQVLDYTNTDAQVTYITIDKTQLTPPFTHSNTSNPQPQPPIKTTKKTRWIPLYSITSNLGDDYRTPEELIAMGLTDPKPQRAPNKPLLSGTYISKIDENEYTLVEIEKVNGTYYIHNVNDANCLPITPEHEYDLLEFSTPEEGKYVLDPGLYIRTDKRIFEIIPFKGSCWTRRIDDCILKEIDEHEALKLTRIETDEPTPGFYIIDPLDDQETQEYDPHLEPYTTPETRHQQTQHNPTDPT